MQWNMPEEHATEMVDGKRPPASIISCAQKRDGAPSPTAEYSTALGRSLRESKLEMTVTIEGFWTTSWAETLEDGRDCRGGGTLRQ